jgi:hypothetical protein
LICRKIPQLSPGLLEIFSKEYFENQYQNFLFLSRELIEIVIDYDNEQVKGFLILIILRLFEDEKNAVSNNLKEIVNLENFYFLKDGFYCLMKNTSNYEDIFEVFKRLLPEMLNLFQVKCESLEVEYSIAFNYLGKISIVFYLFYLMVTFI